MPPGSWANVLKADAPSSSQQTAAPPSGAAAGDGPATTAVVDANAIINGIRFDRMASKVITIPEVLQEVRDKQSRAFMASLPFGIDTQEPAEASSKAGACVAAAWVAHVAATRVCHLPGMGCACAAGAVEPLHVQQSILCSAMCVYGTVMFSL